MEIELICSICNKKVDYLERYYDRHGIYSGKACSDKCAKQLPGQGEMWDYDDSDETIESDNWE